MNKETIKMLDRLTETGISLDDAYTLRRISMALHRWYELECGDGNNYSSWAIVRDETTDKPYMETHPHTGKSYRTPIPDREKGAIKRLNKIMANYPGLSYYLQTDPRGASLYILRPGDIPAGRRPDEYYSYGIAVYK